MNGSCKIFSIKNDYEYIGPVKNGIKEGYAIESTDKYLYKGDFKDGLMHGFGKIIYKLKNDEYEGEFEKGIINGKGTYLWSNQESFSGRFMKGNMHGEGTYKWPNGLLYRGYYINNLKEGPGEFMLKSGKILKLVFTKGKLLGEGILIDANQEITVSQQKIKGLLKSEKQNTLSKENSILEYCDPLFVRNYVDDKFS